jgi:hypothetical protein
MKTLLLLLPPIEKFDKKDENENREIILDFLNAVLSNVHSAT